MAGKQKSSKAGRKAKKGQNLKYKNEHRREQNKLIRLKRHVKHNGMTGNDVLAAMRKAEIVLYGVPKTDLPVNKPERSAASAAFHRQPDSDARRRQMRDISLGTRRAA